jgi:hypothetical protein
MIVVLSLAILIYLAIGCWVAGLIRCTVDTDNFGDVVQLMICVNAWPFIVLMLMPIGAIIKAQKRKARARRTR